MGRRAILVLVLARASALAQGRAGSETEEEQSLTAAEQAFRENRDDEALKLYERVTAINPQRPEPWVKRAIILYKHKRYSESVQLLRKAREVLPNDLAIKGQLGLSLYKTDAQDMAVGLLEEVVREQPDRFQLQLQLGEHYVRRGDGKRAVTALEAYFKQRDQASAVADNQVRPLLGVAYLENHQYNEAQREFETVLKVSPNDVGARAHLGEVFTAKGDWSKAITIFERLYPEAPKQPSIYYNLGTSYLKVNRWADAQRCAGEYTKLRPKEAKGFLLLGDARYETRDLPGALAAYATARSIDPSHPPAAREGRVYLAQKDFQAAVRVLEAAAEKRDDPEIEAQLVDAYVATHQPKDKLVAAGEKLAKAGDPDGLTAAGVAFYAAGEDGRAERLFTQALDLDGRARRARSGLLMTLNRAAQALVEKDQLDAAEGALLRAQKLDPESVQTQRNLGLVLLLEKRYPDAERVLTKAAKKVPRDLVLNRLLARVYLAEKRRDQAVASYEAAAQTALRARGRELAEVYVELGPLYYEQGRVDQAVAVLETAIKEAGNAAGVQAAQRNLAAIYYRRGLERLKEGKSAEAALDDLNRAAATPRGALTGKELSAVSCAAALAALKAGRAAQAQEGLQRAAREGGCVFRPPYDKVGLDFFNAYALYRDTQSPVKREQAARAFQKLLPKAGALGPQLKELLRSSYELEGYDYWQRGEEAKAALALRAAVKVGARGERRELDNNLAVTDAAEGRAQAAERTFEDLGQRPPEALVNLGILLDRRGESKRALELYRRALDRGARAPKLREWIDVKERLIGK